MKEKAEAERITTKELTTDEVLGDLTTKYFLEKEITGFLEKREEKEESCGSLLRVLRGEPFKVIFQEKWEYETGPQWKDRPREVAIKEALFHALTTLSVKAQLFVEKGYYEENFPNLSPEKIKRIPRQVELLADFFRQTFNSRKDESLPV